MFDCHLEHNNGIQGHRGFDTYPDMVLWLQGYPGCVLRVRVVEAVGEDKSLYNAELLQRLLNDIKG